MPAALQSGAGEYRIADRPAEAGDFLLYLARRVLDGAAVTLKVLKPDGQTPRSLLRAHREYELLCRLDVHGVPRPSAWAKLEPGWGMVLEGVGGESLENRLRRGPLPPAELVHLAVALTAILDELHQRRVVHANIQPATVFWEPVQGAACLTGFENSPGWAAPGAVRESARAGGGLAYISPEQTGRLHREVDSRSDLYSLGATLYAALVGSPPFSSGDPMELVHSHLARTPAAPHALNPLIPESLSRIVLRLLAKDADDRYQSAFGLRRDLEACRAQLQTQGRLEPFELGRDDVSQSPRIPQVLYGRDRAREALNEALRSAGAGRREVVFLAGHTGIGKTALVHEIDRPTALMRGAFVEGKCDQYRHGPPYSAWIAALSALVSQILMESGDQLQEWRARILAAVGGNGGVLTEVIPGLELVLGTQPGLPQLGGAEAQNRFKSTFQSFLRAVAGALRPLVVFLDDLQWADPASLSLLESLLTSGPALEGVLLIGAYRDNEVDASHPLARLMDDLARGGASIDRRTLKPLSEADVYALLADALKCPVKEAAPLARLLHAKAGGNPFFLRQILGALHQEGLLTFDRSARRWRWDIEAIEAKAIVGEVGEMLSERVRRLPPATRRLLQQASCLGHRTDRATLRLAADVTEERLRAELQAAVDQELIATPGPDVAFDHDRIEQAAYSSIPGGEREAMHWAIGRRLLQSRAPRSDRRRFEIVDQLNLGARLASTRAEALELARLNAEAGRQAKATAAFRAALEYFGRAVELLGDGGWQEQSSTALELHLQAAEAACLCGQYERLEALAARVRERVNSPLGLAPLDETEIKALTARGMLLPAVRHGLRALERFGVRLAEEPSESESREYLERTLALLRGVGVEGILGLPEMTSAEQRACTAILSAVGEPAYPAAPRLFVAWASLMAELSLRHGSFAQSPFAYAAFGLVLCATEEHVETGYQLAKVALRLLEQRKSEPLRCRLLNIYGCMILPWKEHLRESIPVLEEGVAAGAANGDFTSGSYSAFNECIYAFFMGEPLEELRRRIALRLGAIEGFRQTYIRDWVAAYGSIARRLTGDRAGAEIDGARWLSAARAASDRCGLAYFFLSKLIGAFLFDETEEALGAGLEARENIAGFPGTYSIPVFFLYESLALLAHGRSAGPLPQVRENLRRLEALSRLAPMNFAHKRDLVAAEVARVEGRDWQAAQLYEAAIAGARTQQFVQEEALAYELAARFYLARGMDEIARLYLTRARDCYGRWQAWAKVRRLDALLAAGAPARPAAPEEPREAGQGFLDLASAMKAAQAISSEIVLDNLAKSLVAFAVENAGAQQGALVLESGGRWLVRAQKSFAEPGAPALAEIPIEECDHISAGIVRYVARTREWVLLDASGDRRFSRDPHLLKRRPKSVLCAPVVAGGRLLGVLYLENSLADNAFTPDRVRVLEMLASQAAISLENARYFEESKALNVSLEQQITERRRAEEALRASEERFRELVRRAPEAILVHDAELGRFTDANPHAERLFGRSLEELKRMGPQDLYEAEQPDGRPIRRSVRENTERALAGEVLVFERVVRDARGQDVACEVRLARLPFGGKQIRASFVDISDRKRIENAVRESERRLSALIQAAPVGIVIHGGDGRILKGNPAAGRLLGVAEAEMTGRGLEHRGWRFVREDGSAMQLEEYPAAQVLARKAPLRNLVAGVRRPGSEGIAWMLVDAVPLIEPDGGASEAIVMFMDITERKRAEEQMKQDARRKDEFLAMLGHELRNPLAPIQNASHVLKLLGSPDPRAQRAREMIERQVVHISRLVDDLLDVARIARGRLSLKRERIDWMALVHTTAEDFRGEVEARGMALTLRLPQRPVFVSGDPTRLAQVLSNLLHNSMKFSDRGGRIEVELQPGDGERLATLRVQDTGIGMTREILNQLFSPFFQADVHLARSRGGMGLGLALVKGIVSLHGGTVHAASEGPGRGTCLTVGLPEVETPPEAQPSQPGGGAGNARSILIVEDNFDAAKSLQLMLELMGHRVRVATDGPSSLSEARSFRPEVVVCDIGLPGSMDGYAVARALSADPALRPARLIALTGYGQDRDKKLAQEAGFDAHLTKPADPALLRSVLEHRTV